MWNLGMTDESVEVHCELDWLQRASLRHTVQGIGFLCLS